MADAEAVGISNPGTPFATYSEQLQHKVHYFKTRRMNP